MFSFSVGAALKGQLHPQIPFFIKMHLFIDNRVKNVHVNECVCQASIYGGSSPPLTVVTTLSGVKEACFRCSTRWIISLKNHTYDFNIHVFIMLFLILYFLSQHWRVKSNTIMSVQYPFKWLLVHGHVFWRSRQNAFTLQSEVKGRGYVSLGGT